MRSPAHHGALPRRDPVRIVMLPGKWRAHAGCPQSLRLRKPRLPTAIAAEDERIGSSFGGGRPRIATRRGYRLGSFGWHDRRQRGVRVGSGFNEQSYARGAANAFQHLMRPCVQVVCTPLAIESLNFFRSLFALALPLSWQAVARLAFDLQE